MGQNALTFIAKAFGSVASPASPNIGVGQLGPQNSLWSDSRHARDYTAAFNQVLFFGANATGATLSNGLATTYTGLCLSNPAGSGKNLAVIAVGISINVATASSLAVGLISGWSSAGVVTHTTPVTGIANGFIGSTAASIAKLDAACTIVGTPLWTRLLLEASTGVAAGNFDLNGQLVIPPGGYVAIGASAAGSASGLLGSFLWEEVAS